MMSDKTPTIKNGTVISNTGTFDSKNAYALAKKKNAEMTIEITVKNRMSTSLAFVGECIQDTTK